MAGRGNGRRRRPPDERKKAHKLREAAKLLQGIPEGDPQGAAGEEIRQLEGQPKEALKEDVEHAGEHADEKAEHRGPLGEIFDQMVEHKNQRENPDGEGYVSEGTDRNLMASMLEHNWMKDARDALYDMKKGNHPGAAAMEGALSEIEDLGQANNYIQNLEALAALQGQGESETPTEDGQVEHQENAAPSPAMAPGTPAYE